MKHYKKKIHRGFGKRKRINKREKKLVNRLNKRLLKKRSLY
jgi:hypothetical protein